MHETVFARRIVETAKEQGNVKKIFLELGELGHVPPEELVECIRRLQPDWEIVFEEKPAEAICTCGWSGHPEVLERGHDHFMIECPACGEVPEVVAGTDFVLKSVVIE